MRLHWPTKVFTLAAATLLASAGLLPAGASAQAARGETYKIGVTYPLSGPLGAWGQLLLPGSEIAVKHINDAGGINGRPLQLVVEDTKGAADGAVAAMRKVVQVDSVPIVLSAFTNVVSAQMPLADQFKVTILQPSESPGLVSRSPWTFAYAPLLNQTVPLLTQRWKGDKVKRLFAFFPNTPIAKYASSVVKPEAERLGIAYEEALFKLGDTDFRALITRAKNFNPDAILIFGHGTPDEGVIMRQARELGLATQIYGSCACVTSKSYREAAGKAADGMIFAGFKYDPGAARKLIEPYRARMGFDPDYAALEAYDMVYIVADAIRKHGYNAEGIRRGLAEMKDFKSIGGGLVTMGSDRQSVIPVALYQVKDAAKAEFLELKQ